MFPLCPRRSALKLRAIVLVVEADEICQTVKFISSFRVFLLLLRTLVVVSYSGKTLASALKHCKILFLQILGTLCSFC